ncbi:uncharacterized protein LOC110607765 [Manihot esculenta]|uniref:uncharacterized protein LOC110607765 n=1 Tax=Manihot esculenta TaxID=3983 RepID=UPI000B5D8AA4|nr:uncharacterized protein LOC110607765 [Manihot esculenta]
MAVQDKDFLQWPKPMKVDANRRYPDKYYQYHRTYGYDTNNYYQLISEIERLIKKGHLRNFVKKPEERPRRQRAGPVNDGSSGTINMIIGGTGGRMSRKGRKRSRSREGSSSEVLQIVKHSPVTISFSPEDVHGVQMPHNDALVIEAVIHNYRVCKILVDDGSMVNLLPYRVFQQMRILEEQLACAARFRSGDQHQIPDYEISNRGRGGSSSGMIGESESSVSSHGGRTKYNS